jgi:hypothetical protein
MINVASEPADGQGNTLDSSPDQSICVKRSFLKLPVSIDAERLLEEFSRIPEDAWGVSHWDVHCSIDVLLLRGGTKGKAEDFVTEEVANYPILKDLPYIWSLLIPEGPFGGAIYAFIFRTKPNGVTRAHRDDHEAWHRPVRIHVPIITNNGAYLIAEGMAKHLKVGEVWTFDNQSQHSVVNGDTTRVHMIIDVHPNPKLADLMKNAKFDPGVPDPERWALTGGPYAGGRIPPQVFAAGEPLTIKEKKDLGLNPDGFATRITNVSKKAALLLRVPLKRGDIVLAVNAVDTSPLSRTALDHIGLKHELGETVTLDVLRDGMQMKFEIHLKPDYYFSPYSRIVHSLRRFGIDIEKQKSAY